MVTKAQENVLDALLKSNRQELVDLVRSLKAVTGTKHDCEMLDVADSASLNEMRRRAATLIHLHQSTLMEIDSAMKRIRDGRYGVSETSGKPIQYERLLVIPWARTGINDC